jgi:hypothetical protein
MDSEYKPTRVNWGECLISLIPKNGWKESNFGQEYGPREALSHAQGEKIDAPPLQNCLGSPAWYGTNI